MSKTSVHPYPATDQQPLPGPKVLTVAASADLRQLLQQTETERERVAANRAEYARRVEQARAELARFEAAMSDEIDSVDTILAELDGTADRYRQRLGTAVSLDTPQGDRLVHAGTWNGADAPQTGQFAALAGSPMTESIPDGYCINCGAPVWRSPTAPKGVVHSFGATCSEAPDSQVADLGEQDPAVAS